MKHVNSKLAKRKSLAPADVHIPNKNEAKLLRKLIKTTGMSE